MSWLQGLSRPMRLAGVVLIGVALAAAVVGTTVALSGGDSGENTAAPTSSAAPPPGSGEASPPASPPVQSSPAPPPSSSSPVAPPPPSSGAPGQPPGQQPGAVPGQPGGEQAANRWVTVRVYNNSLIHGLAARAAADLRGQGWNVAEVTNYPSGKIPTTTAYFRPGTDEEVAAQDLAATFGMKAEPRFDGIQQASPGLIVIVTNDYKGPTGKTG